MDISAIYTIELRRGVKVDLLFTPRLYMHAAQEEITLTSADGSSMAVMALYADILYLAARNHWDLTHKASDPFPHQRIDFHAFMVQREAFMKAMVHAMQALSGKSIDQLNRESEGQEEDVKKK